MAILQSDTVKMLIGTSQDVKPTSGLLEGSTFELVDDPGAIFVFDGSEWHRRGINETLDLVREIAENSRESRVLNEILLERFG